MNARTKNKIHNIFIERVPNSLTIDNILSIDDGLEINNIKTSIDDLIEEGVLLKNDWVGKESFRLVNRDHLPVKEYMDINGIRAPRILENDKPRPEEINIFFEELAKKISNVENEIEKRTESKLKENWASIIILFGIFIGLFSLIISIVGKIDTQEGDGFVEVLGLNFAQIIPSAIVLAIFVIVLRKLFK